jgi:protein arginine N-methyltransferase 1
MLKDKIRMNAYAKAIENLCNNKTVLDVGSGSGVLSGNAIKSGAREVYGVDKANIKQIMDK